MDPRQQHTRRSRAIRILIPVLTVMLFAAGDVMAQAGSISGRVLDSQSGDPIASGQIFIPALDIGALSQQNGRYLLLNVPAGAHTVSFERIGYRSMTAEVTVGAGQTVIQDFAVTQDALQLDEVVVTGTAGGTQRRAVGNAITRVDASAVTATRPIVNLQDLMQGRTPGLAFTGTGGQVGEARVIQIRGVSSFGLGSQPLIYIDGVRMDNSTSLGPALPNTGSGQRSSGALNDINPNDIESIEVIKGPAAATLYGTEASAGVIQIITKRGLPGAPQFDLQVSEGQGFLLNPYDMIGSQWRCPGSPPCSPDAVIEYNIFDIEEANHAADPSIPESPISNGFNQKYNLSVRGGVDQVNYFVSGDFARQEGVRSTNWNNQASARANIGVVMSESINLDVSLGYVDGSTRFATGLIESGGLWPHIMWAAGRDTQSRGYLSYTPEEFDIPEATRDFARFNASGTLSHSPFAWLDHRLTFGIDRGDEESQTLVPRDIEGKDGPWGDKSLGEVTILRPITTQISMDYGASARYSPNDAFTFTTSVGAQYYSSEFNRISTVGRVFAAPAIRSIEGATETTATQSFTQNKSLGFYAQEEIGWNGRVFLTAAIRGDDNSTFGAAYNAAYYPKVSATWVVSEESFWNVDAINSVRLRGAWGKAGRQPGTFDAVTSFRSSVGSGGVAAISPQRRGNPDVGPEVGEELEVGFDMAFFNDRLSSEFTYFYQKITDALVGVPLPPSDGFPGSQAANLGQLDNWGYELSLNARAFQSGDWSLDLGAQMAYTMNEIKDLGGRDPTTNFRIGLPWPNSTSTFITNAEFLANGTTINSATLMCDAGVSSAPDGVDAENMYRRDRGGPSATCASIQGQDQLFLGTTFSPWHWSSNLTLGWRDLQVFGMVDAEHNRILNDFDLSCRHNYCGFPNSYGSMTRQDPLFVQSVVRWFAYPSQDTYQYDSDASYIRLREVGLRYQLPQQLLEHVRADRASFSLSARNLWYLWEKSDNQGGVPIPSHEITNPSSEGTFSLFQWPPLTTFEASLRVSF
jgi:TonB-linked SusC/RagA family outer membrane protein